MDRIRDGTTNLGEKTPTAKLTEEQVLEIRRRIGQTQRALGEEFGVDQSTISDILKGRTWAHLHDIRVQR
jgi:DNA-binding MarR family transcriptional regulator